MSHGDINFATADFFFSFIIIACKNKWVIKVNKLCSLNATSRRQMERQESYNSQSCLHSFASPWTWIKNIIRHSIPFWGSRWTIDISYWYKETKKSLPLALAGRHIDPETVEKYLILRSGEAWHNINVTPFLGFIMRKRDHYFLFQAKPRIRTPRIENKKKVEIYCLFQKYMHTRY